MNEKIPNVSSRVTAIADAQSHHWRRYAWAICIHSGYVPLRVAAIGPETEPCSRRELIVIY